MSSSMVSPSYNGVGTERQRIAISRERTAGIAPPETKLEPSFWSVLAQTAKSVLSVDDSPSVSESKTGLQVNKEEIPMKEQTTPPARQSMSMGMPFQKSLDAIATSLSLIGDKLGTAIDEGIQLIEGKPGTLKSTASDQNTSGWKKVEIARRSEQVPNAQDGAHGNIQLKASRDVAQAMASKAKMLLRELKTVKAEQTFLKIRCTQLEEENRQLREGAHQGDDLVRHQLESLLAEKQRLAQENANYARENQLLHEVVEYHHLKLQDIAHLDERRFAGDEDSESYSMDSDDSSCYDQA